MTKDLRQAALDVGRRLEDAGVLSLRLTATVSPPRWMATANYGRWMAEGRDMGEALLNLLEEVERA